MPDSVTPAPTLRKIADLLADPEAERWAQECGWLPGSGYCQNRDCTHACLFHAAREGEAARIKRARASRRPLPRLLDTGRNRIGTLLLSIGQLLALA